MYGLHDKNDVLIQKQPNMAAGFIDIPDNVFCGQIRQGDGSYIDPPAPNLTVDAAQVELNLLYDAAIITLQNGFSDQEEKSFTEKREIIAEYEALDGNGDALGVAGLSAENIAYMQALTGSADNLVIVAKIVNMVKARSVSRLYSPLIEFERNTHIDQLVEGADNSAVVESLAAAYAALGG